MEIVQLNSNDAEKVIELFKIQSGHVSYYRELAKQYGVDVDEYFNIVLKEQFREIMKLGQSYGIVEKDELIGYFLCFCVQHMKSFNESTYEEIFKGAEPLMEMLNNFNHPTCFIICADVVKNRSKRYLGKLFRLSIDEIAGTYNFITDIIPDELLLEVMTQVGFSLNEKRGYRLYQRLFSRE